MAMSFEQYSAALSNKAGFTKSTPAQQQASYQQYLYNQTKGQSGKDYGVKADPTGSGKLVSKSTGNTITNNTWSTNSQAAQGTAGATPQGLIGPNGGYTFRYNPSGFEGTASNIVLDQYIDPSSQVYIGGQQAQYHGQNTHGTGYVWTVRGTPNLSGEVKINGAVANVAGSGMQSGVRAMPVQSGIYSTASAGGNTGGNVGIIRKLDPFQNTDVDAYLRANPQLQGISLGGTYHKSNYYDPNATGAPAQIMGDTTARVNTQGGGPFRWQEQSASAPSNPAPAPAPGPAFGGGGGGGGGGGSSSAPSAEAFGPREPLTHQVVRTGPESETTQGQLVEVLDEGGPIMRRAVTRGMQIANDRGLINSSIAEGAAMGAVMEQAVPIAMSDANTHFTNSMNNLNAQNQFRAANNAAYLESMLQEQQGSIQERLTHISGSYGIQTSSIAAQASYMDMWLRMQMDPYLTGDMKANLDARVNPFVSRPIYV